MADAALRDSLPRIEEQESLHPGVQPLHPVLQDFFGAKFQFDFGGVRIHTDARTATWAQSLQAFAFTRGEDIGFARGQYDPGSPSGMHLLAHELTHVMQQRAHPQAPRIQRKAKGSQPEDKTSLFKILVTRPLDAEELRQEFVRQYYAATNPDQIRGKLALWTNASSRGTTPAEVEQGYVLASVSSAFETDPESLPAEEREALERETDRRYLGSPGRRVGSQAPAIDRQDRTWLSLQHAVLTEDRQFKEILALPQDIREILFGGGPGAPALSPDDYAQVLRIAKRLSAFSPEELRRYLDWVNASTGSWSALGASLDAYARFLAEREREAQEQEAAAMPLFGAEDLYGLYVSYRNLQTSSNLGHALKSLARDKAAAEDGIAAIDERLRETRVALMAALHRKGFDSIPAFEAAMEAFRISFRTQAVNLALDVLARYEHMLFRERQKLGQPGIAATMSQGIAESGAAELYASSSRKQLGSFGASMAAGDSYGMDTASDRISDELREESKAEHARAEAAVIRGSGGDPLVAERGTDRKALAKMKAGELQTYLEELLRKRTEDVQSARRELAEDPDKIFSKKDVIEAAQLIQGIDSSTIYGWIIRDYLQRERLQHLLSETAVGILALALALLVPGGGWAAAAALIGSAGISGAQAYGAYKTYEEEQRDYRLHFLQEEPSLIWVGIAVAAAALDLKIATGQLLKESAAGLKALEGPLKTFSTENDLAKLLQQIDDANGLRAELRVALKREAKVAETARLAWQDSVGGMRSITPEAVPVILFRGLYHLVARGVTTLSRLRKEAAFLELVGDITRMSGAERAELEAAFSEVKQLLKTGRARSMDETSLLNFIDRWALNRSKPGVKERLLQEMKLWKPLTAEQQRAMAKVASEKRSVTSLYEEMDDLLREREALLREREALLRARGKPSTDPDEIRERLFEINQRLGQLDPSSQQQTTKQWTTRVNELGETEQRLIDVPIKHPPGQIQVAEARLLEAEKEAARAELSLYDRLRAAAPSPKARSRTLQQVTADQVGPLKTTPGPLQADHVVSVSEVAEMEGFRELAELSWKDAKEVADIKANLIAMDRAANASKNNRTWASWPQAANFYDGPTITAMIRKESLARAAIQKEIGERLAKIRARLR